MTSISDHFGETVDRPTPEYRFYFAAVFAAALPFTAIGWLFGLADRSRPNPGPVRRALSEARTITPLIFCA